MDKRWVIKKPGDAAEVTALAEALDINKSVASLLVQRGLKSFDDARKFFRPELENLHDPFNMMDMNQAVDRIMSAMDRNEKILVYGDYDVDGTTSVALLYSFFNKYYSNLGYYIPDRDTEGYGVSTKGVDYAGANNYSLIISIDCGIKAIEKVKYAKDKGIDFIICDHHMPGETLPEAVAILDPKRKECGYPFKELSGCGVGFKLIQAYARINGIDFEELIPLLQLVAVSIAADIVPIVGENRILAFHGLEQLNTNPGEGIKSIRKIAGIADRVVDIADVIFKIGPRINAAGRMETGSKSVELLLAKNREEAFKMSQKIDGYNKDRRVIDQGITQDALMRISSDKQLMYRKSTVLYNPKWHKGVIGIVASRLIETYFRPTVVLTESNGMATGSARSVPGFDLYEAMESCSHLLENFGGHMYAAGLTLKKENISEFEECFEKAVSETITDDQLIPVVDIDAEINFKQITDSFVRILKQFQPFGPENMAPVFVSRNVVSGSGTRLVGASGEHIKLELIQENGIIFNGIAFSQSPSFEYIQHGQSFDICYSIDENEFRGRTSLQLNIKDIKPSVRNA
ncbi:MAG: single-stranded-DNA-specific exonuclease RecJ [Bacteroidota bacterium]|nr:single-stranded-DNA-specific exonuclease RecJ [Bacteroidota bacterium]